MKIMELEDFTDLMKAMSDSNRVRILQLLSGGELCVCQILEVLDIAPSTLSKHISVLKNVKIIKSRKSGRWIYYRLSDKCSEAAGKIVELASFALEDDEQVLRDREVLEIVKKCSPDEICRKQRGEGCC